MTYGQTVDELRTFLRTKSSTIWLQDAALRAYGIVELELRTFLTRGTDKIEDSNRRYQLPVAVNGEPADMNNSCTLTCDELRTFLR